MLESKAVERPEPSVSVITSPELRAIDEPLPSSSQAPRLYTIGAIALSAGLLLAIITAFVLAWQGKAVPDMIGNLGTICGTTLGAMFAYRKGQEAA